MNQHGFVRVGAAVSAVTPADCDANAASIIELARTMASQGVRLAVFPELSVCGYTCGDLLQQQLLQQQAQRALGYIAEATAALPIVIVVGVMTPMGSQMANSAAIISGGKIHARVHKTYLPNYGEFYEKRWYHTPENPNHTIFQLDGMRFGIELCEDMWAPVPPSARLALAGAEVILNLSASDALVEKRHKVEEIIKGRSSAQHCAYVYASSGYGESTTDLVFDGMAIIAENGNLLATSPRWQRDPFFEMADIDVELLRSDRMNNTTFADCRRREDTACADINVIDVTPPVLPASRSRLLRPIDPMPFVPSDPALLAEHCDEIINIQSLGLARRLQAIRCSHAVIGVSGGLDSTLALLVCCNTFDLLGLPRTNIHAVTMPGFGTSSRTRSNADVLMEKLIVDMRTISIVPATEQHFADIGQDPAKHDVTYENSQARIRTLLLMDLANRLGGIVIGTGDLSELALGWATYNGDHMSMYGLNAGVPKTAVREVVRRFATLRPELAATLVDIIDTPVSPELLPTDSKGHIAQSTEDIIGSYELHDFFIFHTLRCRRTPATIYRLACTAFEGKYTPGEILSRLRTFVKRFFSSQFKRSCLPDGPKVGSVSLSPRGDWRMPSDASAAAWLKELDTL